MLSKNYKGSGAHWQRYYATSLNAATKKENRINILTCAVKAFKVLREIHIERMKRMQSILQEFFYGNISPEVQFIKKGSEYDKVMHVICCNEEKLLARLNKEEKEILQEYIDAQMELNSLTAVKSQIYGYKLGLLMTAEVFVTGRDLVAGS